MTENRERRKKWLNAVVITINGVLVLCLLLAFFAYENDYKQKLFDQNVDDIVNMNQASANICSNFYASRESKLKDIALYITANSLTVDETMAYIRATNSDGDKAFELIGKDLCGWRITDASKDNTKVDYSSGYDNISRLVTEGWSSKNDLTVRMSSEFTDAVTAMKSFAQYLYLQLPDDKGELQPYTLMLVTEMAHFADRINLDGGYEELSIVIINQAGAYIIGNANFKATNFFDYLYVFNDLTLDEKLSLRETMQATDKGALQYLDARSRPSVFVYAKVPDRDWYCVSAVPISQFHNRSFDISFTLIAIGALILLMLVDCLYLAALNRRMKISAENERIASAAKTDFLSRMSHDIRTPLNVILGMLLLAQGEENPPETQRCLKNIDEAGKFLLGLVNDILDLNKVESGRMELHTEPYAFTEFRSHIEGVIAPLCQAKGIRFEMKGGMADRYVLLDRLRVNQIFFNLLSNAVKFTPEGGTIQLICNARMLDEKQVSFDFEVKDNGLGMSQEFQEHMFEAFSQENRRETASIQGTGLGLAIVSNLVKLMGGTIRVESELGQGTTFYVHIETTLAEEAQRLPEEALSSDMLAGKRVLLCEDHPLNAQIAMKVLEKKGMKVEHACDGEKGVGMFAASAADYYDVILMDIRMPIMDGLAATRAIRALQRPDAAIVPIIAMTANAYDIDKKNSFDAGMNAHIAKPIDPKLLYSTLEEQLARRKQREDGAG